MWKLFITKHQVLQNILVKKSNLWLLSITAIGSMTCIIEQDAYELHMGNEEVYNDFIMNAKVLHLW